MLFCNSLAESISGGLPRCYTITKVAKVLSDGPLHPVRRASATTMHWFRSRSRWGSYLALFALAFQLALTFGHVHLDRFALPTADKFAVASADASSDARNAPADPAGRDDRADHRCPICTLIHLAGALVLAEPPSLPLPAVFGRLRTETAVAFDFSEPQRAFFAARAPPTA
jgi:hypothetical protein